MKTLYESILNTDTQAQSETLDKPLQELIKFLMLDKRSEFKGTYEIKNGKLYVNGHNRELYGISSFYFTISAGKVVNMRERGVSKYDLNKLNFVHFENVQIRLDTYEPPMFLANCNNCIIIYKGFHEEAYKGLDKILSKTKGDTISIWGTETEGNHMFLSDYSYVSGLNFSNCRVTLYNSADLSTIKNLTARELIIQRGSKFEKGGPIFEADRELSDYFVQKLDEFLARNKITSFGMVNAFVQYIDWFVKKEHDYKIKLLRHYVKRVPRIH